MKRILRYFGYVTVSDLLREVDRYEREKNKKRHLLHKESINLSESGETDKAKNKFIDGLLVGYEGIGALQFVNEFLATSKTT